jgi:hypothetical protein
MILWSLLCASASLAQSTLVVAPNAAQMEADVREAASGIMTLMTPSDNATMIAAAADAGLNCGATDLACWQRVATLGGASSVLLTIPAVTGDNAAPSQLWFSAAGLERRTPVLSSGVAGMRFAIERLQEKSSAVVVSAPQGALIMCDAKPGAVHIEGLTAGDHIVSVEVNGSKTEYPIALRAGEVANINANSTSSMSVLPVAMMVGGGALLVGGVVGAVVFAMQHQSEIDKVKANKSVEYDATTPKNLGIASGIVSGVGAVVLVFGGVLLMGEGE